VKVLVTGGRGLLGSATARWLADAGHTVTVLQRGDAQLPFRQIRADITDEHAVDTACRDQDAIVHLAAKVSITGPAAEFERVNVGGTARLLAAAHAWGIERFIYVSSPSVAHAGRALVGETAQPADPARARSHYSRSKAQAEQLVLASDLATVAIRPHLVWGPGDPQLIHRIVTRGAQGRLALLGSGGALIDTTYVDNAASAIGHALERVKHPEVRGRAFVVSNGEPRTVRELLQRITSAAGVPGPRRRVPARIAWLAGGGVEALWWASRRSDDPPMTRFLAEQLSTAHWFDQRATQAALAWRPQVSLDEGFRRLAAWHHS
jgi:nucleoside-diphosphate-sugar epimerase